MNTMANMELDTKKISAIIKACGKAGVQEFSLGELRITFGTKTDPDLSVSPLSGEALSDEDHRKLNEQSLEQDEVRTRENQMEELLITDPAQYERLIIDGEFSDGDEVRRSDE